MESSDATRQGRILLAKVGADGHDRGIRIVATVLRDAGYEVIYLGKYLTSAAVVQAAIDEDADMIGLSLLQGSHMARCKEILQLMQSKNLADIPLVVGGVIPLKDSEELSSIGVAGVFPTNTTSREIVDVIAKLIA